jgi:hypothetical protein
MTTPAQPPTVYSFADVRGAYRSLFSQQGYLYETPTVQDAVIQLMASLGELATYCKSAPMNSEFEREELHDVIGSLAISLSVVGDVFHVDPCEAALCRLQRLQRKENKFSSASGNSPVNVFPVGSISGSTNPNSQVPAPAPAQSPAGSLPAKPTPVRGSEVPATHPGLLTQVEESSASAARRRPREIDVTNLEQADAAGDQPPLSPNTVGNFFPMLDVLESRVHRPEDMPPYLTFCIPMPDGSVSDLIPDGRNIQVTFDRWKEYLQRARYARAHGTAMSYSPHNNTAALNGQVGSPSGVRQSPPTANALAYQAPQPYANQTRVQQWNQVTPPPALAQPQAQADYQQQEPGQDVIVRRVTVHPSRPYDPEAEARLFSPSHFSRDLFSPHNQAMAFNVPYNVGQLSPVSRAEIFASTSTPSQRAQAAGGQFNQPSPNAQVVLPASLTQQTGDYSGAPPQQQTHTAAMGMPPMTVPIHGAYTTPARQTQAPDYSPSLRPSMDDAHTRPYAEQEFEREMKLLQQGVRPEELHLFFTIPYNGEWVDLVSNGRIIQVTSASKESFLKAYAEKLKELSGRVRRATSMKTLALPNLAVYNPNKHSDCFSPTHFQLNLFAPYSTETTFAVDYDRAADVLPAYIQNLENAPGTAPSAGAGNTPPPASTLSNLSFPDPTHYIGAISGREDVFRQFLEEVKRDNRAAQRLKMTYCYPLGASVADIGGGRYQLVQPSDVPRFLAAVYQTLPHLNR